MWETIKKKISIGSIEEAYKLSKEELCINPRDVELLLLYAEASRLLNYNAD